MGYKKITVSSKPAVENDSPAPFVKTITAVEIKDCFCEETQIDIKQKKSFPINGCALFISLCAVLGLLFVFIPIPEPFANFLENIIFLNGIFERNTVSGCRHAFTTTCTEWFLYERSF